MTNEQLKAYQAWYKDPKSPNSTHGIFKAGWDAALADRPIVVETIRLAARQTERHELRKQLLEQAAADFLIGDDERAKITRELVIEIFGKI